MPSPPRRTSPPTCWNCDRHAPEPIDVTFRAPSGGKVAVTLCQDCRAATYLPLAAEVPELLAEGGPSKVVLVVDDEPDIRSVVRLALEGKGYAVEEAAHGLAALHAASRRMPNVVVLDLRMPVMDGHQFIAAWRQVAAPAPVPVVAISAHEHPASTEELGVEAFLPKPFDLGALVGTVDRLLTATA